MDRDTLVHHIMRDAYVGHGFFFTKKWVFGVFSHGIYIHIRAHFAHIYTDTHITHRHTRTMGGVSGWELAGFLELLLPLVSDRV